MDYAQDPETYLTPENLKKLFRERHKFFRMPRGSAGAPGTLAHAYWQKRAAELQEAGRAFHNGEISFKEAARRGLQAHLEMELFRNEHGTGEPTERRSSMLTGTPIRLSDRETARPAPRILGRTSTTF